MRGERTSRPASWVWALSPLWSLGLGTAVAMVFAAVRRRSWAVALSVPVYVAATGVMVTVGYESGQPGQWPYTTAISVNLFGGLAHALAIRRWVFPPTGTDGLRHRQRSAVAAQREVREARVEARRLLAADPVLARELGIGRPDLPGRTFPDGGLIDFNAVSAHVINAHLGLPLDVAQHVVALREQIGGFSSYDDLLVLGDLDHRRLDQHREVIVFSRA